MARILTELPATKRGGASSKYPWDEWLDGQVYELVRGEDFEGEPDAFRRTVYSAADRLGKGALTRITKDGNLAVQAVPEKKKREKSNGKSNGKSK